MSASASGQRPFIGREQALATLRTLLQEARDGRGSLVLVAGEAGIGKTRLVREALRATDDPHLTGFGVRGEGQPFGPIARMFRTHLRRAGRGCEALGAWANHLHALLPELGRGPPASGDRGALLQAVAGACARLADDGVRTVFLDDVQWVDEATIDLLEALDDFLAEARLAVVGAYRSEEMPIDHPVRRLRAELRRRGRLHEVVLEPFGLDESMRFVQLVRRHAGSTPPATAPPQITAVVGDEGSDADAKERMERLHHRARGVPFYLEELAAAALDDDLPESIRDAVLVRLRPLSQQARRVLDAGSVFGSAFGRELLAELLDHDHEAERASAESGGPARSEATPDLDAALAEIGDLGLWVAGRDGAYTFRHDLIREAVQSALTSERSTVGQRRCSRRARPRPKPSRPIGRRPVNRVGRALHSWRRRRPRAGCTRTEMPCGKFGGHWSSGRRGTTSTVAPGPWIASDIAPS